LNAPRVTALINTYNYGRYVEEAIESVLGQDFPRSELEVLVVDDGSTDDTAQRVKRFGDRVRYVRKENGGQASAINVGFEKARGGFVAFLDADDVWLPQKLSRVMRAFEARPDAGLVYHAQHKWDTEAGSLEPDPYFYGVATHFPATAEDLWRCPSEPTSALTFRREAARELLPVPESLTIGMVDAYMMLLMMFVAPVVAVTEHLGKYRIHGQNIGHGQDLRRGIVATLPKEQIQRRIACNQALLREMRNWLRRRGIGLDDPVIATFLRKWETIEEAHRFRMQGAGRTEYFAHLRRQQKLQGPHGDWRYRLFQFCAASAAFLLGYERFTSLRERYAKQPSLLGWRENIFPTSKTSS
jgi:glycosyltransferase involved in cell wall biosynthesis